MDSIILCVAGSILILLGIFFDRIPLRLFSFTYVPKDADMQSELMIRLKVQSKAVLKATGWVMILCAVGGMLFHVFWLRFYVPLWVCLLGGLFLIFLWTRNAPRIVKIVAWIGVTLGVGITAAVTFLLTCSVKTEMIVGDGEFVVKGMYSLRLPYAEIDSVYLSPAPPYTTLRTNGLAMNGICKGYFRLKDGTRCYLNTDAKVPVYIYLIRKNEMPAIVNWQSQEKTEELYRMLKGRLPEIQ